jgi:hypothetical protein
MDGDDAPRAWRELSPRVVRGKDFVAITSSFRYQIAAPGKKTGSEWSQVLVIPAGQRYFISSDKISSVNASDAMFLRLDMPGHIKHCGRSREWAPILVAEKGAREMRDKSKQADSGRVGLS